MYLDAVFKGEICIVNRGIRFQVFWIMIQDHKHQRKFLVIFVVLTGGFFIFMLRNGIGMYLKAIEVCSNVRTVTLSTNIGDRNQVDEPRRRAIKSLFISKNTLSFCKRTIRESLGGMANGYKLQGIP